MLGHVWHNLDDDQFVSRHTRGQECPCNGARAQLHHHLVLATLGPLRDKPTERGRRRDDAADLQRIGQPFLEEEEFVGGFAVFADACRNAWFLAAAGAVVNPGARMRA